MAAASVELPEVGTKLHAKFTDGALYPAEVVATSESKKRSQAPVKVTFLGYGKEHDLWLPLKHLRSKKLGLDGKSAKDTKSGKKSKKSRVAILGGALDPPTLNHLLGAAEVIHSGMADEVWLMPCGPRPDKPKLSQPLDRYIMTQLAVNTFFSPSMPIHASDFEVMADEAFATYDSLCGLREKYPSKEFLFVIGTDWLQPGTDLRDWTSKCPETGEQIVTGHKLISEFEFLVIQRPGYEVEDVKAFGPRMTRLLMPEGVHLMEGNLSSTEVRKRTDTSVRLHQSLELIEGLVVPAVLSYIHKRDLYSHGGGAVLKRRPSLMGERTPPAGGKRRNVAVFGGAFDPPTNSHILALAEIVHSGVADEAMLVPCGPRPDKPHLRSPLVRYTMCQLACTTMFSHAMPVRASPIEVFEKEALATYDSLCALRDEEPESNFMFVIGSDWLQPDTDIRKWTSKCPETGEPIVTGEKLVSEFDFIVIRRPGHDVEDLSAFGPRMKWMEMPHGMKSVESNLSSTEVRRRAGISYAGKGKLRMVDGLVPSGVLAYISREDIYKPAPDKKNTKTK
eukprot:TRINITY_DN23254_c0_g7_i1.p1 TRINITY_DN23254_c0_g7~~TRINITY_DN23254_c0_g7_i1.p1  ORF type:complete len:563 (-),score=116.91 TRINITY_DN23254_c0_g7_i1:141-1829(-)